MRNSQLYAAKQDLIISQTTLAQQETVLKNALSRSGVASMELADVHVIPLDKIEVPPNDDARPLDYLVAGALNMMVEIEQSRINLESNKLNLVGIKNSLEAYVAGLCRTDEQWPDRSVNSLWVSSRRRALLRRRLWQSAGSNRTPEFSELFGGLLAQHLHSQSRCTIGLCYQPHRNTAERVESPKKRLTSPGGRAERGHRSPAGPCPV